MILYIFGLKMSRGCILRCFNHFRKCRFSLWVKAINVYITWIDYKTYYRKNFGNQYVIKMQIKGIDYSFVYLDKQNIEHGIKDNSILRFTWVSMI